jgi:hypothetical protein
MMFELPTKLNIGGTDYAIRSDYRAVLEICTALSDTELTDEEKALVALMIFYPDFESIPPEHLKEAIEQCFAFIDYGQDREQSAGPRLMDWEKDFSSIVAPINRVAGMEIRSVEYMHWWTFLSYFFEIGDCLFAQVVRIRDKLARNKKLEKAERDWLKHNRHLVDIQPRYTKQDEQLLEEWGLK